MPLKLYWHAGRGDNFVTATARGEDAARAAGCVLIRVEGYVFASPQSGTVPLKNYWSEARGDNFATATAAGEASALAAGYVLTGIEGYLYPP